MMRHAARRLSLSGTAPPFRGRRVTATPYAPAALLVADRPFPPPLPRPRRADDRASAPRALEPSFLNSVNQPDVSLTASAIQPPGSSTSVSSSIDILSRTMASRCTRAEMADLTSAGSTSDLI